MPSPPDFSVPNDPQAADLEAELAHSEIGSPAEPLGTGEFGVEASLEAATLAAHIPEASAIDAEITGRTAPGQKNREINSKARRGIKMMMGRQGILQILTLGGGIVLARLLDPATFGIYGIITFLVSLTAMFANFGLAPSLVQRRDEIGERDLRVAFTMQQVLITLVVAAVMLLAPSLIGFYRAAPPEAVWMLRAMAFSLYLTSWRTMSKLQLERAMNFDKIARIEVAETAIYQLLAVVLALAGQGIWSFVIAALARGLCGTLLSYLYAPWPIRFAFDRSVAAELLRFGVPYQANAITQSIGNWVTPVFVGAFLGPQYVGYLTFASSNGRKPLMIADSFVAVSFPHFSRLQDDLPEIERILVRYLTYLLLAAGIWSAILVVCGGSLVELIYGAKWRPSEAALAIFSVAMAVDIILRLLGIATSALGHVKKVWGRTAMRTAAQLLFAIPAIYFWEFNGVPIAYLAAITTTMPFLFTLLGKGAMKRTLLPVSWIALPWLFSIAVGYIWMRMAMPGGDLSGASFHRALFTVLGVMLIVIIYAVVAYYLSPQWLKKNFLIPRKEVLGRG